MINKASKKYIEEVYKNVQKEKDIRLKDLETKDHYEYYMHYNIFLTLYEKDNYFIDNQNNNNNINNDINSNNASHFLIKLNNYLLKFASCYNEIGDYFSLDEWQTYENEENIDNISNKENNIINTSENNIINTNENNIINTNENNIINTNENNIINTNESTIINSNNSNNSNTINTINTNEISIIHKNDNSFININENDTNKNNCKDQIKMNKKVNKSFNFINILCVGRTGSGKSTFINNFFDERLCNVGRKGTHQTQRINYYSDYKSNIRLYDTIGLEGDVSSDKIVDLLEKLNVELINCNEKIHLILYFIQDKTINF